MVGAAEGLGGKLIRTVSFLGWTLPVSFLGGTAPLGMLGMFSAICLLIFLQIKVPARESQTLIPALQAEEFTTGATAKSVRTIPGASAACACLYMGGGVQLKDGATGRN